MHPTCPPSSGRKKIKLVASLSPIRENVASPFEEDSPHRSSRFDNQHLESNQNVKLQVGVILFLAIIQIFIIVNLLNGSLTSHATSAMIKISYSRHQLLREAAPTATTTDLFSASEMMHQAIADIASLRVDTSMSLEQQNNREKALRAIFNADRTHHTLDPTLLCRSEDFAQRAAKQQQQQQHQHHFRFSNSNRRLGGGFNTFNAPLAPYFDEDYSTSSSSGTSSNNNNALLPAPIPSSRVILSTYFGSRVDPYRCFELPQGKLTPDDAFHTTKPLVDAVERLDLTAVVFHDGALSDEFIANVSASSPSNSLFFQKVELRREDWSLADERWLVYSDWLRSPAAAEVEWVLALDLASTTIATDPFDLMESSEWLFSLWTDTVPATPREVSRLSHCYAHHQQQQQREPTEASSAAFIRPKAAFSLEEKYQKEEEEEEVDPMVAAGKATSVFLKENDVTFNSGVIGGTKTAFLSVVYSLKEELERLQIERGSAHAVWNCEKPALHRVLKTASLQGQRVFTRGNPFVGDAEACTEHGYCEYAIYREV